MTSIPQTTTATAADFAPGARILSVRTGRVGTIDPDAVDASTRRDYPGMVPVQWDGDDAWLTNPAYLELVDDEHPPASARLRPGSRFRVTPRGDEHDGTTGTVRSTFTASDGEPYVHVTEDDGTVTMWEASRLEPAVSADVRVLPPSSVAGIAAVRHRVGDPAGPVPTARRPRPGVVKIAAAAAPFGGRLGIVDASNRRGDVAGMVRVHFPRRVAGPAAWGTPTVAYYDPRALEYVQRPTPPRPSATTGDEPA